VIEVIAETRTVWRSAVGRRGRLSRRAAYLDAAWQAWRAKYPCECEAATSYTCSQHRREPIDPNSESSELVLDPEMVERRRRVIGRLARWLMWRDRRVAHLAFVRGATGRR